MIMSKEKAELRSMSFNNVMFTNTWIMLVIYEQAHRIMVLITKVTSDGSHMPLARVFNVCTH